MPAELFSLLLCKQFTQKVKACAQTLLARCRRAQKLNQRDGLKDTNIPWRGCGPWPCQGFARPLGTLGWLEVRPSPFSCVKGARKPSATKEKRSQRDFGPGVA
jgi:hypothetical protein